MCIFERIYKEYTLNKLYSYLLAEPVGCERCNYHGACYSRDDRRILCECFQWYSGSSCQINLKGELTKFLNLKIVEIKDNNSLWKSKR